jgi:hydrogenase nickel incorporation protein HypB
VETARDAARLVRYNVPVSLVNTQGGCHLESVSIEKALAAFNLNELDLIFIENVGNLVCPAEFDLGEDAKVAVMSTPEGDDKVMKYPLLFRESELVLLNKIDLLSATDFKRDVFYTDLKQVNAAIKVIEISCKNGAGLDQWLEWLERKIAAKKQAQ